MVTMQDDKGDEYEYEDEDNTIRKTKTAIMMETTIYRHQWYSFNFFQGRKSRIRPEVNTKTKRKRIQNKRKSRIYSKVKNKDINE